MDPEAARELVVENGTAKLVVRDLGGDGRPVVLLHGYTGTPYDFVSLRPRLAPDLRVVELELRAHARSTAGTWSWDEAVSDVDAVIEHLELRDVAVVGFSFGGMIAAVYAEAHPEASAVVNIDGYGAADLPRYVGSDAETMRRLEELHAFRRSRLGRTLTQEELDADVAEAKAAAVERGRPPDAAREAALRRVRRAPDGAWERLPAPPLANAVMEGVDTLDLPGLYERIECPLLTVLALQPNPAPERPELSWLPELSARHIAALRDELRRLAESRPNLELVEVDAPHGRLLGLPVVFDAVNEFIARHAGERGRREPLR